MSFTYYGMNEKEQKNMVFTLDTNDIFEGGITDGIYEVVIDKVIPKATPGGTEYVQFDLIVRNDVDQKFKNVHIFHSVWKAKATGKYNPKAFNTIGKACRMQNGKVYNNFDEMLADFEKRVCKVKVKNETSTRDGKTYENLNVKEWGETQLIQCMHSFKTADNSDMSVSQQQAAGIQVDADNLPF